MECVITPAETTFEALRRVVEASPGRLTAYRDDFYKCDKDYLNATWFEGVRYLWLLRETGTCMCILGIHETLGDFARAHLANADDRNTDIYLVSNCKARQINLQRAHHLLSENRATFDGSKISYAGVDLVRYVLVRQFRNEAGGYQYEVHMHSLQASLGREAMVVLHLLVPQIVRKHSHSLFTKIENIMLDGEQFDEMFERSRT